MKNGCLFVLIALFVSCGTQKIVSYEYAINTRDYNFSIVVDKDSIKEVSDVKISKNEFSTDTYPTSPELWNALEKGSERITLKEISKLESPTNKRQFDGAMFANLTLITKDTAYNSAVFDHGQPPIMLKTVVDSLVSLSVSK